MNVVETCQERELRIQVHSQNKQPSQVCTKMQNPKLSCTPVCQWPQRHTCPIELATLSRAAPTGPRIEVPNHLCLRAPDADSLWLGWYCIKLINKSQPPLSLRLSRSKPSWESLLILRSCVARQAPKSHFKPSSLRLKVHSWLSLQQCT